MKRLSKFTATGIATLVVFTSSFAHGADKADIVETAVAAGSFKTLAAALGAADLAEALKGKGPFTVFAPTDEAFSKLPKGTVESLLKPENKDQLTGILTYHVVSGQVPAKQVVGLAGAKTLNGQRVDITVTDGKVKVDSANVVATDIMCTNGVIHVIDSVILPSSDDLVTTASNAGSFKTLIAAASEAGLVEALTGNGPLTVFAPTDEAFAKLPKGTVEALLKPENKAKLANILKYHVVAGRVYSEDAVAAKSAKTLQGSKVNLTVSGGKAKVQNAALITTDIDASNGVIHVIDAVIMPPASNKVSSVEHHGGAIQHTVAGSHHVNVAPQISCSQGCQTVTRGTIHHSHSMPVSTGHARHVITSPSSHSCQTQQGRPCNSVQTTPYVRIISY